MWIFMNDAFLSVVEKRGEPETLIVRARMDGDLEKVFRSPVRMEEIEFNQSCDYPYRIEVLRERFALIMAKHIQHINYSDFKGSVQDKHRHDTYMEVWSTMINKFQKVASLYKWVADHE